MSGNFVRERQRIVYIYNMYVYYICKQYVAARARNFQTFLGRLCLIHKLDAKVCKYQVATSLIFTDLLQLNEVNRLAATCNKLEKSTTCSMSVAIVAVLAMHTLFGKSVKNNHYCYRQVSKSISNDSEKITHI